MHRERLKALAHDPNAPTIQVDQEPATPLLPPPNPPSPKIVAADYPFAVHHKGNNAVILELAGIKNGTKAWSSFFAQAYKSLPKRSLKIPVLGLYENVHSGEELVSFFVEHLLELEGDRARAAVLAGQLTKELAVLRLVGELGNRFHDSYGSLPLAL